MVMEDSLSRRGINKSAIIQALVLTAILALTATHIFNTSEVTTQVTKRIISDTPSDTSEAWIDEAESQATEQVPFPTQLENVTKKTGLHNRVYSSLNNNKVTTNDTVLPVHDRQHMQQHNNNSKSKPANVTTSRHRITELPLHEDQVIVSWQEILEKFPAAFEPHINKTRAMAMHHAAAHWNETSVVPPSKPFLNLGMPKAGSSSLHAFLKCAGYNPCHYFTSRNMFYQAQMIGECMNLIFWGSNFSNQAPKPAPDRNAQVSTIDIETIVSPKYSPRLLEKCDLRHDYDGHTQMDRNVGGPQAFCSFPQHEYLETLYNEAPNATLFLPFRNFEAWMKSSENWRAGMLHFMDKDCPYFGLDGFDSVGVRHKKLTHWKHRQERQQRSLVSRSRQDLQSGTSSHVSHIFSELSQLRGRDTVARIALFLSYHVTYIRSFVAKHPSLTLIEYQLESDETGSWLSDIFHVSRNDTFSCWETANQNTKGNATVQKKS
jgi:hypothetical protein